MSPDEKDGEQEDGYIKTETLHNSIPTSLFLSDMCLLLDEDNAGTIDRFLTKSMFTQTNNKQRSRGGVINEFLFGVGILLFPFIFMR